MRSESGQAAVEYALIACAIIVFIVGMRTLLAHTYQVYVLHNTAFHLSYQLPKQYRYSIQCLGDSPEASLAKINTRLERKLAALQDSRPRQCPNSHWVFSRGDCNACDAEVVPLLASVVIEATVLDNEMSFALFIPRGSLCQGLFNEVFTMKLGHRMTKQYTIPASVDCR